MTIIDCVSDLHGFYPNVGSGDLLIVCGDLTARDESYQYSEFMQWLENQKYKSKIIIAGNHDNQIENGLDFDFPDLGIYYLCDSGTEFEGLKVWGSPWTLKFKGMNPACMAFTCDTEEELAEKWAMIPQDTDILITHSPPYRVLDKTIRNEHVGSKYLTVLVASDRPKLHIFGHIHESYGKYCKGRDAFDPIYINASHVNERYEPINPPIRVIL